MTDNITLNPGTGGANVRTLDRGTAETQVVALDIGGAGAEALLSSGNPMPVAVGNFPGTFGVTGTFWQAIQPISGTVGVSGSVAVTGPLTDAQLRASAVPVSGPLTDTQLRASAVPVFGPLTDTQLRANPISAIKGQQTVSDCIISSGASLSADVDLGVYRLVGLFIPATFEPTTISFQSSFDNTTWNNVFGSDGIERTVVVGVSRRVVLSPADFYGIRYIRIRGGTAASPVVVAANRTIKLIAEA